MLRISKIETNNGRVILMLEGKVSNGNIEIARESVHQALETGSELVLDLAGVMFIDRQGVSLFQELQQRQIPLVNCSPFLKEQLKQTF